ncbi:hypothetical protein [Paractinoplanes ferrugineus]|uniref:hypothetical protein n=1 Tax=Paractinoplanes ferrugineus TaxID=113564 RepID=UPI001943E4BC|nr:hypothetical protein [Actinoplanes ferrugineus]
MSITTLAPGRMSVILMPDRSDFAPDLAFAVLVAVVAFSTGVVSAVPAGLGAEDAGAADETVSGAVAVIGSPVSAHAVSDAVKVRAAAMTKEREKRMVFTPESNAERRRKPAGMLISPARGGLLEQTLWVRQPP